MIFLPQARLMHPDVSDDDPMIQEELRATRAFVMGKSKADKDGNNILSKHEFVEWLLEVARVEEVSEQWKAQADSTEFDEDDYMEREIELMEKYGFEDADDVDDDDWF